MDEKREKFKPEQTMNDAGTEEWLTKGRAANEGRDE